MDKYLGKYKAIIVSTIDPTNSGLVKVWCPLIHDEAMLNDPEKCPIAMTSRNWGGSGASSWGDYKVNDIVYISFINGLAENIVVEGALTPIMSGIFAIQSLHSATSSDLDMSISIPSQIRNNFSTDNRPYGFGMVDRYGNGLVSSYVGFVPPETKSDATINEPDFKYISLFNKSGNGVILSDIGYIHAENEYDSQKNIDTYYQFYKYIKRSGDDQRRVELRTNYGHSIIMSDAGYNVDRYTGKTISKYDTDYRAVIMQTRGGHTIDMSDIGLPLSDIMVSNDDLGDYLDRNPHNEDDYRIMRLTSRGGHKLILDDRGFNSAYTSKSGGVILQAKSGKTIQLDDNDDKINIVSKYGMLKFDDISKKITMTSNTTSMTEIDARFDIKYNDYDINDNMKLEIDATNNKITININKNTVEVTNKKVMISLDNKSIIEAGLDGTIIIKSSNAEISADKIKINGDTKIFGRLEVTQDVDVAGNVKGSVVRNGAGQTIAQAMASPPA